VQGTFILFLLGFSNLIMLFCAQMACEKVEKLGKCKSAMLYSVLDIRGRLDKKGGKRSKGGKKH